MVPASQSIVFLLPSEAGSKPWQKDPKPVWLDIRAKSLSDKNMLLRNFSNQAIAYIIDKRKPVVIPSGEMKSLTVTISDKLIGISVIELDQHRTQLIKTAIRVPEKSLSVFAFYNAAPKTNANKSIGVFRTTVKRLTKRELNKIKRSVNAR